MRIKLMMVIFSLVFVLAPQVWAQNQNMAPSTGSGNNGSLICVWCGNSCMKYNPKAGVCAKVMPPKGMDCMPQGNKCVVARDFNCRADGDCLKGEECYQPLATCPPGKVCNLMMPAKRCRIRVTPTLKPTTAVPTCIPKPANCRDGVYCDPKPGVVFCPDATVTPTRVPSPSQSGPDSIDLIVVNRVTDSKITPGKFSVETIVANKGNIGLMSSGSGYKIGLYVDPADAPLNSGTQATSLWINVSPLGAGQTQSSVFDMDLEPGSHSVVSWVDVDNSINESDEDNNMSVTNAYVKTSCGWCGFQCTKVTTACLIAPHPQGKSCITQNDKSCLIIDDNVSPTPSVQLMGDANGDKKVDLVDFSIWKKEYLEFSGVPITSFNYQGSLLSDFNHDQRIDLVDFSIWKRGYLGSSTTVSCVVRPKCMDEGIRDANGNVVYCSPPPLPSGQVYCSKP